MNDLRREPPAPRLDLLPGLPGVSGRSSDRHVLRRGDGIVEIRPGRRPGMPAFELLLRAGLISAPLAVCAAGVLGRGALLFLFTGLATAVALGLRSVADLEPGGTAPLRGPTRSRG